MPTQKIEKRVTSVTETGREAGASFKREARKEEEKVEAEKGSELAKGEKRVEERSRSSDGKSAGEKQL